MIFCIIMSDFTRFQVHPEGDGGITKGTEFLDNIPTDTYGLVSVEKNNFHPYVESSEWFSGRWSCKGGDWKRNDELSQDNPFRKKLVLNEGYPLCQMPTGSHEDPRWHCKDEMYYPVRAKKHDLPLWAFSSTEEDTDSVSDTCKSVVHGKPGQNRQPPRGVKGMMLPVVGINSRVVKDQSSVEPRTKPRGVDRPLSRSSRSHSIGTERSSAHEGSLHFKKHHDHDSHGLHKSKSVPNIPKDRVCTADELSVNRGDWYYLDGTGHEHGPFAYSELQELVKKGTIVERSSVFRKIDNTWFPILKDLKPVCSVSSVAQSSNSSAAHMQSDQYNVGVDQGSGSFHELHPQFVGYTRGKLHELVMKYFKSRELTLAINEVLDPWISAKQPKKEFEAYFPHNSASRSFLPGTAVMSYTPYNIFYYILSALNF